MEGQGALFDPPGRRAPLIPEVSAVEGVVVRVVADVRSMRNELDYLVAPPDDARVEVGSLVDVDLGGRRLKAWVVAVGVDPPPGVRVRPVRRLRSVGPDPSVTELTAWGAWRFAGARSALLGTASSPVIVRQPAGKMATGGSSEPSSDQTRVATPEL